MKLPPVHIDQLNIKLVLDSLLLNVLYVKFGYFHSSMRAHSHSLGTYELHYVPSGRGSLIAQGKQYVIEPGTLFITGPGVIHEQITDPQNPMAEYCIFFEIISDDSHIANRPSTMREPLLTHMLLSTPFWIGVDNADLLSMFEILADQIAHKPIGWHSVVTNILEVIIIRTIQQYSTNLISNESAPVKTLDDNRLLIIENSFLYHYATITLEQLAEMLSLSPRQTQRAVVKQYGIPFQEKKLQARMEAASSFLLKETMSISEIAEQIGFTTSEQFSNAFKKHFGMTASQYRKLKCRA